MIAGFTELGLPYTPSYANFMWVDTLKDAKVVNASIAAGRALSSASATVSAPPRICA